MVELSTMDWLVLAGFGLLMIGVVVASMRQKEEDTTDYFLAGRNAGWLVIGASIFASNIGSEHLVGLSGSGAESGMALAHWELQSWIILLLGWIFVPFYWSSNVYTMPEFLERRFNSQSRSFLSVISLVSYVLTKVAVTVYAGGVAFKTILGNRKYLGHRLFLDLGRGAGRANRYLHRTRRHESHYVDFSDPDTGTHYWLCGDPGGWFG